MWDWLTEGGYWKILAPGIHWINQSIGKLVVFHTIGKSETQISPMEDIRQQLSQRQGLLYATLTASRDLHDESRWLTQIMFSLWDLCTFPAGQLSSDMAPFIEWMDQISTSALPCWVFPHIRASYLCLGQKQLCRKWMPEKLLPLRTKRAISPSDSFLKTPDYYHFVSHYRVSKLLWIPELLCIPNSFPRREDSVI